MSQPYVRAVFQPEIGDMEPLNDAIRIANTSLEQSMRVYGNLQQICRESWDDKEPDVDAALHRYTFRLERMPVHLEVNKENREIMYAYTTKIRRPGVIYVNGSIVDHMAACSELEYGALSIFYALTLLHELCHILVRYHTNQESPKLLKEATPKDDAGATFEFKYLTGFLKLVVSASFAASWTFPIPSFAEKLIIEKQSANHEVLSPTLACIRRILKSQNLDLVLSAKVTTISKAQMSRIVTARGHETPVPQSRDAVVISVPERRIIDVECLKARERRHEREAKEQLQRAKKRRRKM